MTQIPRPVVFVHGLWLHHTSWQPWMELFREHGYAPVAPAWPGEADTVVEARQHPERVANQSLAFITEHFRTIIAALPEKPIIIGHSFGGLITEKLMGEGLGAAGVAIDPAQIKGVLPLPLVQLRSAFPVLSNPANISRALELTREQFRFGFGNALSAEESDALHDAWMIPSPVHCLFEVAVANFVLHPASQVDTHNDTRGPLLLISGLEDHTAPDVVTKLAYTLYKHSSAITEFRQFEGRGHSIPVDHGWREVAERVLAWLNGHGL